MRGKIAVVGVAGLILAALACALFWWLEASTRPSAAESAPELTKPFVPNVQAQAGRDQRPVSGELRSGTAVEVPPSLAGDQSQEAARVTVGDILGDPDEDHVRVAKKLTAITLDPGAPMEEREEALAHALNLSVGNEAEVLTPLVKDPRVPDAFAETILDEALNRPLSYQADLYLAALAARKAPEIQTKIREHLAFLTGGEDRGPDPAAWREDIQSARPTWAQ